MRKYYCPYCNPKYQFIKEERDGRLSCGLCGEDLIKESYISTKQIFAFLLVGIFILPLILIFIFAFIENVDEPRDNNQTTLNIYWNNSKTLNLTSA